MTETGKWEVIEHNGNVVGTVRVKPNQKRTYAAYKVVPVCPGYNWTETYPTTNGKLFRKREDAIQWLKDG